MPLWRERWLDACRHTFLLTAKVIRCAEQLSQLLGTLAVEACGEGALRMTERPGGVEEGGALDEPEELRNRTLPEPRRHGVGLAHLPEHCQLCRCNHRHRIDAIFGWSVVHHVFERACSLGHPARPLDSLALARP